MTVPGAGDGAIETVIFDWGGTLTAWHDIDFHAESLALCQRRVAHHPRRSQHHRARAGRPHRGRPDAVAHTVADVLVVIDDWR